MKVKLDRDECSSCEVCVDVCEDVFELDDDENLVAFTGKPGVLEFDVPEEFQEACEEAAESCPSGSIVIEE